MDDYEGRHEVEQSLADVEHQLASVQDYLGLDARHPRVKDFIKCVTEFSPWVKDELEKIADLKSKKKSLEEKMDQLAIEGFKIRLSRRFSQPEMAQRAKEVRDLGAQVLGLNERINNITANIHDKAGGVSELLEDAAQFSFHQAPVVSIRTNADNHLAARGTAGAGRPAARDSTPSASSATGLGARAGVDHLSQSRKKRKSSGQLDTVPEVSHKRDSSSTIASAAGVGVGSALAAAGSSSTARAAAVMFGSAGGALPIDPAEPLYCLCRQVSYGEMIACDNPLCKYEWFHFRCVKITEQPVGKWYCPLCRDYMANLNGFFDPYTSRVDMSVADEVMREHSSSARRRRE